MWGSLSLSLYVCVFERKNVWVAESAYVGICSVHMAQNAFFRLHFRKTIDTHVYRILKEPSFHYFWRKNSIILRTHTDKIKLTDLTLKQNDEQVIDGQKYWHSTHAWTRKFMVFEPLDRNKNYRLQTNCIKWFRVWQLLALFNVEFPFFLYTCFAKLSV